jgi:hypothetical protein
LWLGLFVGVVFSLFTTTSTIALIGSTMLYGAAFGAVWGAIGYAFTRGQRDFTSVSRIVPGRYEVLAEHKVAAQAREILRTAGILAPAAYAAPPAPTPPPPAPPAPPTSGGLGGPATPVD